MLYRATFVINCADQLAYDYINYMFSCYIVLPYLIVLFRHSLWPKQGGH